MEKFRQKYRIPSTRLQYWDYGSPGLYFVTICTKNRELYFGNVQTQYFASPHDEQPKNPLIDEAENTEAQNITSYNIIQPNVETQYFASPHDEQPKSLLIDEAENTETQNITSYNIIQPNVETQYFASPHDERPKNPLIDETQNISTQNSSVPNIIHPNTETQNIASLRSAIGNIANQYWQEIPKHFPFVELDEYVIMPNHIHGILFINKPEYDNWKPNKFGPQSQNLASVIRGYKAGVKTFATAQKLEFAWQPRFHDRIIRSQNELNNIRRYIISNPIHWHLDKDNPDGLLM